MENPVVMPVSGQSDPQSNTSQQNDGGKEDPNRKKTNVRKRTKTGCLTCRKRRIKCDEGRPRCNNCIKSKRVCEGYNQRVVFKEPMGSLRASFNPTLYPAGPSHLGDDPLATHPGLQPSRIPLQAIAPRPPTFDPNLHSLPTHPEQVLYQTQFQVPENPALYGLNPNQFPPTVYSQLQNPLISPGGQPGIVADNNVSEFQCFNPEDQNAGEASFHQSNFPQVQPSSISLPVGDEWEYDVLDDEASIPDSDEDVPDSGDVVGPVTNVLTGVWGRSISDMKDFIAFVQSTTVAAYIDIPHMFEFINNGLSTVFVQFINVTGPSISLYERHSFDAPENDRSTGNNELGRSPWGYTFPVLALRHPGLMQAMLALASLQIAKLQDSPPTTALKHYHRAIRRIAKNVQSPLRRTQPATLAATLLLGYFEVWSSDHTKWCNHLFGARILLREIPLREMTRLCLPMKKMRRRHGKQPRNGHNKTPFPGFNPSSESRTDSDALDYDFITAITGLNVLPEHYSDRDGQILDERCASTTEKDIERYDTLCDLFWWYCKMDVYQSVLGGTKLFMEYECWIQCPPRAPASKHGAIYGTYDHLMLLLGRLANFSSRDLSRKRKASKAQGGGGGGSPPMFPGMLPTHGTVHVPMGFSPPRDTTPQSDSSDDIDPAKSYDTALREWESIHEAFKIFEAYLGGEFQPLSNDHNDNMSPFGPAIQFQTYSIAGIWMNYYMGLIHLHRSHPLMPPAAMRAAGMTGHKTGLFAIRIGQIAAGLSADCSQITAITSFLGAALIESSFCLFVAAVQFRESNQRQWIIQRMYDIVRLTGWQSARQIADGCESAWTKAAQMGGPPYTRTSIREVITSMGHNPRRIDRKIYELDQGEEKRLVLAKAERTHYALGLLGVEDDLKVLELRDDLN